MDLLTPAGTKSWLTRKNLTEKLDPAMIGPPFKPTPKMVYDDWQRLEISAFHDKVEPGDELWSYNDFGPLSGSAGYVLLRGDVVIALKITVRS